MKKNIITILMVSLAVGLHAQQKISLSDCRAMALEQSEQVKIADKQVEKAETEKAAMRTNYLPSISGSVTGVYLNKTIEQDLYLPTVIPDMTTGELTPNVMVNPSTGEPVIGADGNPVFNMYAWMPLEISLQGAYMAGLTLEQPLYTGGKIMTGNKMAALGVEMAKSNKQLQQANSLYEADQTYWLYVSVNEKVRLAKSYVKLLDALVKTVNDAYETGMVTKNDVLKVKVKQNEAQLQLQKANSGLELTRMALCRVTGLDFNTQIEATDTIIEIDQPDVKIEENNLSNRPEYELLKNQVEMANHQIKLAKADFLPTAGVRVGYSYIGGIELNNSQFSSNDLNVMASVNIPIFHWGEGIKKTQSAQRDKDIKQLEMDKNSRLMELEIEQARLNFADAKVRVNLANETLIQAEANLKESNDNYEVGMEILTNLLEAQLQWQNAYSETIDAKTDYKLKESALLKATGALK